MNFTEVCINGKVSVPDCSLKQVPALNHLIHECPAAAACWDTKLVIVAECYREDHHANILKHFHPLAALVHAFCTYSNQLVSEKR